MAFWPKSIVVCAYGGLMKIPFPFIAIAFGTLTSMACQPFGGIPVVGLRSGRAIEHELNRERFGSKLTEHIADIESELPPRIDGTRGRGRWEITSVNVGFGFEAEGGIGPVAIGGQAGIMFTIERSL
jgi:hypothetical protein